MFERCTEKARRVIFFARYEASQFGSPVIETEHLLLGILRDDAGIARMLPPGAPETIRTQIEARIEIREKVSISVDLPLSNASKRVLAYGAEEAERWNHRHIGSEHLCLGLLRQEDSLAAKLLQPFAVKLERFRTRVEVMAGYEAAPRDRGVATTPAAIITIHGLPFKVDDVPGEVRRCRLHKGHWRKASWKPQDCVIERQSAKVSLDITLAEDSLEVRGDQGRLEEGSLQHLLLGIVGITGRPWHRIQQRSRPAVRGVL